MAVKAHELDDSHIGAKLSYGPGMMFSGIIDRLEHSTNVWLGGKPAREMETPKRVFVQFTHGGATTLSHSAEIQVRSLGTKKERDG